MEGRINRDSLTQSAERPIGSENRSAIYKTRRSKSGYGSQNYGDYKRKRRNQRETIPDGKDMLAVQILACGVLLLFVMFVALFPSSHTADMRNRLKAAFSKNTSIEEVTQGIRVIKDKFAGIDNPLRAAPSEESLKETVDKETVDKETVDKDTVDKETVDKETVDKEVDEEVAVDEEILKMLKEQADAQADAQTDVQTDAPVDNPGNNSKN